jgi:hypothetical protein
MYQRNLIALRNFYTGQVDRLNITCAIHQSITSVTKKSHLFDIIIGYYDMFNVYRRLLLWKRFRLSINERFFLIYTFLFICLR